MTDLSETPLRLSGNQLKIIALIAMTCDHVGVILLPHVQILRIIGRISMPIFAWMIAQGCRYTRSPGKYLGRVALLGVGCQIVMYIAIGALEQGILITFSLSIGLILLLKWLRQRPGFLWLMLPALGAVFVLTVLLPKVLTVGNFCIDYGIWGVLLPVLIYVGADKKQSLLLAAAGLALLSVQKGGNQWYCLLSLPLLALYDGQRGERKLKYVFYIYYPVHLAVIYLLWFAM